MIYLDNAATTSPYPEVVEEATKVMTELWANPSSLYSEGVKVKNKLEEARKTVANFINAKPSNIIFTSSGSEANCLGLTGWAKRRLVDGGDPCIVTTDIEHKSIHECVDNIPFVHDYYIGVDERGYVSADEIAQTIKILVCEYGHEPQDILFSIQHVNNELGIIQPIKTIAETVHLYDCLIHVDAVQSVPHIDVDVDYLDVDMLSASAHKFHGLRGAGFLYVVKGTNIDPIITGSQERGLRGGTENVVAICAMAKALEVLKNKNYARLGTMQQLYYIRSYFISKLEEIGCKLNVSDSRVIPTCINIQTGVSGEALMYLLDTDGICVSTGSACNSKSIEPSYVLKAIGLTDEEAAQSIRITFSEDITMEEIDNCVDSMERCIKLLRGETINAKILDVNY